MPSTPVPPPETSPQLQDIESPSEVSNVPEDLPNVPEEFPAETSSSVPEEFPVLAERSVLVHAVRMQQGDHFWWEVSLHENLATAASQTPVLGEVLYSLHGKDVEQMARRVMNFYTQDKDLRPPRRPPKPPAARQRPPGPVPPRERRPARR